MQVWQQIGTIYLEYVDQPDIDIGIGIDRSREYIEDGI